MIIDETLAQITADELGVPLGDISVRERNLLGRGQDLRLSFTLSQRSQQAVAQADAQIKPIFAKWRSRGLVGGQ